MAFITRLSRLMRADLHALLDRLEAPDLVLAQAVREMEQALDEERRGLVRTEREIQRLRDQEAELSRVLDQTRQALDDCLAAGREDLARPVIRRRLETERQAAGLKQGLHVRESDGVARQRRIAEQESRLLDLKARAALYEKESAAEPDGFDPTWVAASPSVRDADVEVALLRAKRQREGSS
jgi:phage shock protein A